MIALHLLENLTEVVTLRRLQQWDFSVRLQVIEPQLLAVAGARRPSSMILLAPAKPISSRTSIGRTAQLIQDPARSRLSNSTYALGAVSGSRPASWRTCSRRSLLAATRANNDPADHTRMQ
jgi:hypothetical protein